MTQKNHFQGRLGSYIEVLTEDGSSTFTSQYFAENCHSTGGAFEETVHNYIEQCRIELLLAKKIECAVLDVGFGMGIGLYSILKKIEQLKNNSAFDVKTKKFNYYTVELDDLLALSSLQKIKEAFKLNDDDFNLHVLFLNIQREGPPYKGLIKIPLNFCAIKLDIFLFLGNARQTLTFDPDQNPQFHAIFQDAFSPKKNPQLWTVEWFQTLKNYSAQDVILSTYSASVSIRKSLLEAGFMLYNTKGFKHKKTMTVASLNPITEDFKHKYTSIDADILRSKIESLKDLPTYLLA